METRDGSAWMQRSAESASNETKLAKAKIFTMLQDLSGNTRFTGPSAKLKHQNDASKWFFGTSDFEDWCDTAGYDPDYIRQQARRVMESGLPRWRAAAGEGRNYQRRKASREGKRGGPS